MYSLNCSDGDNVLTDQVRTDVQDDCRCCSVDGRNLHNVCLKQVDAAQNSRSCGQRSADGHYNTWPKHAVVYAVHDARTSTSRYQRNDIDNDRASDDKQGVRFAWPNCGSQQGTSQQSLDASIYDSGSKQTTVDATWESTPAGHQRDTAEQPLDGRFDGGSPEEEGDVYERASTSGYQ